MSWISGFADKAEELLNKIDENAAVILKKDKSSPSLRKKARKKLDSKYAGDLGESTEQSDSYSMKISHSSPAISGSTSNHHYPDLLDSTINHDDPKKLEHCCSEKLLSADKANITEEVRVLLNENAMLKNEIRTLNNEVSLLLNRVKESDRDSTTLEEKFSKSEAETVVLNQELNDISLKLSNAEYQCHLLQTENERFCSLQNSNESSKVLKFQQEISELQVKSQRQEEVLLNKITCLERRLGMSESQLAESESERKRATEELRLELEQFRTKVHQQSLELDRYRANSNPTLLGDLKEGLTGECARLREELEDSKLENKQAAERLELAKKEMSSLQLEMAAFRDRALSAEHLHRNLKQELESVRREMMDNISKLTDDVKERETELRQAKSELGARRSQDTWQSRVANLTSALVRKQAALEQASTESAQLRLQLERTKNKCRKYSEEIQLCRNVNDTDDVKAQVPYMFMENPFDRGLTKRVKQVYSAMDSVATRVTAILLRRYPIARIIVLIYMIVLHSMVCLILYSWTPDTK